MDRDKHFTTGLLAFTWAVMLAILVTALTLFPRGVFPALEFLGFPFILVNIFLLARLTLPKKADATHTMRREQLAKLYDIPRVQYHDRALFHPKNPAGNIYAAKRRSAMSRM